MLEYVTIRRLYLLWIQFSYTVFCVCNLLVWKKKSPKYLYNNFVYAYVLNSCMVLNTGTKHLNYMNSVAMGQINQCWFQSHVAIDHYSVFLEIKHIWVQLSCVDIFCGLQHTANAVVIDSGKGMWHICGDKPLLEPIVTYWMLWNRLNKLH